MRVNVVKTPQTTGGNFAYVGNNPPLVSSPQIKLPFGSIHPKGWLRGEHDLAVHTDNRPLLRKSHWWIDKILYYPDSSDYFGPTECVPVEFWVRCKRIPNRVLENEAVQELRRSPIKSDQPEEIVKLILLGCARLQMACLPPMEEIPDDDEWI